jgi:hypothetical protein
MNEEEDRAKGLADVGAEERYYTADGTPISRRLVKILADMVEAAMKRVRKTGTDRN